MYSIVGSGVVWSGVKEGEDDGRRCVIFIFIFFIVVLVLF